MTLLWTAGIFADQAGEVQRVEAALDGFHAAASQADEERYFGHLAPAGVFIGTDAGERWPRDQFREFVHPYFARGQGWTYEATSRHVSLSGDGSTAWFDELLHNANYGECRGTGVLQLHDGEWKIEQYHLTIPIPNELADEIVERIRGSDEAKLDPQDQWPQWRGPLSTGVAPHGDPPVIWSAGRNVRWAVEIPGSGQSTPIVWGDRIFLTTAIPHGDPLPAPKEHDHGAHDNLPASRRLNFAVLAVDRRDGKLLWQRTVRDEQPHEGTHETGSWASNSAVTDGEQLWAFFGSRGLYCLDFDGKVLWEKRFGDMQVRHGHGEGASPALYGDTLVVNWDHQGDSFVVALDKNTGEEKWRKPRDEITSWSTPLVVEHGGKAQVVISATGRIRSYDLATGEVLWHVGGLARNVVASPVAGNGMVFIANSYDWQKLLAIRLDAARGALDGTEAVVWSRDRDTPYVPSPVLDDGALCFVKHLHNVLTCLAAESGETLIGPARLPGIQGVFSSPVAAAGRLYVVGRRGATAVLRLGDAFELLSLNRLDDEFAASPAIVGRDLYLRGRRRLYAISEAGE